MSNPRDTQNPRTSRRQFTFRGAGLVLGALLPRKLFGVSSQTQRVLVRTDAAIGIVRPEFHGQFAEHLGPCVYRGIWVAKNSPIPNIGGYRKQVVEYLRELEIPVLRWPWRCGAPPFA